MRMMEITIHGNVGSQPTLMTGTNSQQWVRFGVGTNSSYRDQKGNWVNNDTTWFTCKAWGNLAVNISKSLHKGDPVVVEGRLVPTAYLRKGVDGQEGTPAVDLNLHVSHIGIDVSRATTMNVKHVESDQPGPQDNAVNITSAQEVGDFGTESSDFPVSEELVEEIDSVEHDSLAEAPL